MALRAAAPAGGAVGGGDLARACEAGVAVGADVVVSRVAGVAVEAGRGGGDGVVADVAVLADGERDVLVFGQVGDGDDEVRGVGEGAGVRDGEERVRAVVAAVETGGAVAPGAFKADVAVPVGGVGEGVAEVAEGAFLGAVEGLVG